MRLRSLLTRSLILRGLQGDVSICHSVAQGLRPLGFTLADHQGFRERGIKMSKKPSYLDYLPEDGNFTEEDLWDAIADSLGVDSSEISDGDLVEFI